MSKQSEKVSTLSMPTQVHFLHVSFPPTDHPKPFNLHQILYMEKLQTLLQRILEPKEI